MVENLKFKYEFRDNTIYCGDNEIVLKQFPPESVDLIYIDPPFFSGKNYEVIWKDGYELKAYKDRWQGGIEHYIGWMRPKIELMKKVLKPTGSFYLHCDYHAGHYLKVICDKIFGYSNFQNEIIWHYFMGGKAKRRFARKHDTIFLYSKSKKYYFDFQLKRRRLDYIPSLDNPSKVDLSKKVLTGSGLEKAPITKMGKDKVGHYSIVTLDDVWDLSGVFNMSHEYMGYPTQKPESLLEVIITASSNENDIILDAFCGCGTALAVAKKLNRRFIGIDISPLACDLTAERIKYKKLNIVGMKYTMEELKKMKPLDFQYWIVKRIGGTPTKPIGGGDKGIDGKVDTNKYGLNVCVEVKNHKIGYDPVMKFESVVRKSKKKAGYMVGFGFTRGAVEEIARFKREEELEIIKITVEDLFKNEPKKYNIIEKDKLKTNGIAKHLRKQ